MASGTFFFWTAILLALLIAVSVADLRTKRIPDALNAAIVLSGLGFAVLASPQGAGAHAAGAVAGFVPLALFGEAFHRLRGYEGLGLGDAKLFAGAGAWLGWRDLPLVLLIASLCGLAAALVWRRRLTGGQIAFGPFLALGIAAVWLARAAGQ